MDFREETSSSLASKFSSDGYLIINDLFPLDLIDQLKVRADEKFSKVFQFLETKRLCLGIGVKNGYKEIVQRHQYRYEIPFEMDDLDISMVSNDPFLQTVASEIIGADFVIINQSIVWSVPGAKVICDFSFSRYQFERQYYFLIGSILA